MFKRFLHITLPKRQSCFLWGARKTGKSTYLKATFPNAIVYDFLKTDVYLRYSKAPHLFREEIVALSAESFSSPIIVDEIQKIPVLLDEIHWLIENTAASFILCGSSARKLKRGAANLLGGRAWRFHFYPLTYAEIPEFNLEHAYQTGLLPAHYLQEDASRSLRGYIEDYMKEEIQAEGLVRNIAAFARFLDIAALTNADMVNYTNIARECGVDAKTVKEYFHILEDTLLGYSISPFSKHASRALISTAPKFYLFDIGVVGALLKNRAPALSGLNEGKMFEHYILMELVAYQGLNERTTDIHYWRTKTGLEVDFILNNGDIAIEVKHTQAVRKQELRGLLAFCEEYQPSKAIVISQDERPRVIEGEFPILVLPWRVFLERLWKHEIL